MFHIESLRLLRAAGLAALVAFLAAAALGADPNTLARHAGRPSAPATGSAAISAGTGTPASPYFRAPPRIWCPARIPAATATSSSTTGSPARCGWSRTCPATPPPVRAKGGRRAVAADQRRRQRVAYTSPASNLVAGQVDGNGANDVFLWSRDTDTTVLVSHRSDSGAIAGTGSFEAAAPGRQPVGRRPLRRLYQPSATNLIPGQITNTFHPDLSIRPHHRGQRAGQPRRQQPGALGRRTLGVPGRRRPLDLVERALGRLPDPRHQPG